MKKIPTLFVRQFENHKVTKCTSELTPGLEWIFTDKEVIPTVKIDGSCCMIDKYGRFYRRYDAKPGRKAPVDAIPCQAEADPVTGHWPHWVPVKERPGDIWYLTAFVNTKWNSIKGMPGTYEAIGPHFQGNPYNLRNDILIRHGLLTIRNLEITYNGIKQWLESHNEEGIVFWHHGEPICKIKRSDFGLPWPVKEV